MVELTHSYYKDLACTDLDIIPSDDTLQLLRKRQMICRMSGNKLIVLVKVKTGVPDEDKPLMKLDPNDQFLFYLKVNNEKLATITNIDIDKFKKGQRFYFTNIHENDLDDKFNLTAKIEAVAGSFDRRLELPIPGTAIPADRRPRCRLRHACRRGRRHQPHRGCRHTELRRQHRPLCRQRYRAASPGYADNPDAGRYGDARTG